MRCAKSPSSVISTNPVVSLSSLPAGKRFFLFISSGRISTTVTSPLPSLAETTPCGLLSIIYTCSAVSIRSPDTVITQFSVSAFIETSFTASPLRVISPFRARRFTSLRVNFPLLDIILSSLSTAIAFSVNCFNSLQIRA